MCCKPEVIPNLIDTQWTARNATVVPYAADLTAAITGYVLNNESSTGPVTVNFLRGGPAGGLLPFQLTVNVGEYRSFAVSGVDTIKLTSDTSSCSGELNINVNFNPF